jgi:hypothetical protein
MYLAFQQCLEMSQRGASLKECLDRFPQFADELEPLLVAATGSAGSSGPVMSAEMRSRLRGWVLSEWDRQHQPRRQRWSFSLFAPRWAMATAAAVLTVMVLIGGAGTAAAAHDAIPGTILYPVKQLEEEARLWITRSPEVKVVRYGDLVRERAQELRKLAGRGDAQATSVAVSRMERHIKDVNLLLENQAAPAEILPMASLELELLATVEDAVSGKDVAAGQVQDTLRQAPADAYPCLRHTVRAIQKASQRVHDAVGQLRGESAVTNGGFQGPLCP